VPPWYKILAAEAPAAKSIETLGIAGFITMVDTVGKDDGHHWPKSSLPVSYILGRP